jgi:hypothetical protein
MCTHCNTDPGEPAEIPYAQYYLWKYPLVNLLQANKGSYRSVLIFKCKVRDSGQYIGPVWREYALISM